MMMTMTVFFTIHSMPAACEALFKMLGNSAGIVKRERQIINIINSKQLLFTKHLLCSNILRTLSHNQLAL